MDDEDYEVTLSSADIRSQCAIFAKSSKYMELLDFLQKIENYYGSLKIDLQLPTLYNYRGIAYFELNMIQESAEEFEKAIKFMPTELRAWMNLAELRQVVPPVDSDGTTFSAAMKKVEEMNGGNRNMLRIIMTNEWKNYEFDLKSSLDSKLTHFHYLSDNKMVKHILNINQNKILSDEDFNQINYIFNDYLSSQNSHANSNENDDYFDASDLIVANIMEKYKSNYKLAIALLIRKSQRIFPDPMNTFQYSQTVVGYDDNYQSNTVPLSITSQSLRSIRSTPSKKMRLGFIFSHQQGGPVQTLSQRLYHYLGLHKDKVLTYAYILTNSSMDVSSPHVLEMMTSFHTVAYLDGLTPFSAANVIHSHKIDVLFDMNGYGISSGLLIMSLKPAPIQVSYLGEPITAATHFIDYFLSDSISSPPDITNGHFSEKLILMPICNLVNSHSHLMRSDDHRQSLSTRYDRKILIKHLKTYSNKTNKLEKVTKQINEFDYILGMFHTFYKIDPSIFHVSMNILHRLSGKGKLMFNNWTPSSTSLWNETPNLVQFTKYYGIIPTNNIYFQSILDYPFHFFTRTAVDLYLDTITKNGHTTTADAAWSGIPIIGLGGGDHMRARSTEAVTHSLGSQHGIVYSLKEYEDVVVHLLKNNHHKNRKIMNENKTRYKHHSLDVDGNIRLQALRSHTEKIRFNSHYFDTKIFADYFLLTMQATCEVYALSKTLHQHMKNNSNSDNNYHILNKLSSSMATFHVIAVIPYQY
eukprot:gene4197-5968_t